LHMSDRFYPFYAAALLAVFMLALGGASRTWRGRRGELSARHTTMVLSLLGLAGAASAHQ
jgi:hypothetical protein